MPEILRVTYRGRPVTMVQDTQTALDMIQRAGVQAPIIPPTCNTVSKACLIHGKPALIWAQSDFKQKDTDTGEVTGYGLWIVEDDLPGGLKLLEEMMDKMSGSDKHETN